MGFMTNLFVNGKENPMLVTDCRKVILYSDFSMVNELVGFFSFFSFTKDL
jgi:hypothetical protein